MREIMFRPLRRIKKTGQIVVASYPQWSKVMTADYTRFDLIINDEYKLMPDDEYVYNHKGELLYFLDYNPADVPVFQYSRFMQLDAIRLEHKQYGIRWDADKHVNYNMAGADCQGTPTFTHFTQEYVSEYFCNSVGGYPERIFDFNPLTVKTVRMWFGWFLWQLNNSILTIGK